MKFGQLVSYLEKLDSESSRLKMTDLLVELLREIGPDEAKPVCYLLMGRLAPRFVDLEFNLADKMVVRALAVAYRVDLVEVGRMFKDLGDLGLVVTHLETMGEKKEIDNLSILEVYARLKVIAEDGGEGSQERKVEGLAELLRNVGGRSGKYVVRMVLSKLRLGFSDKTILDALSVMEKGDKSARTALTNAYQKATDIGWLAEMVKSKGIERAVTEADVVLGVPIEPALCSRLKTAKEMFEKMGELVAEPKFDGTRCVGGYTGLLVRNKGYLTVRELVEGDEVMTHGGRFCKVLAKTSRYRRDGERVFEMQTFLGDRFRVSEGHKMLIEGDGELSWIPVEEISEKWVYFPKPMIEGLRVPEQQTFVDAASYSKVIIFDEDFFRFLGFWVGDGFSSSSYKVNRIGLVLNKKHKTLIEDYERIIKETLQIPKVSRDVRPGAICLYWKDDVFRKWLCDNFRGHAEGNSGKRIPEWFFGLDEKRFRAFLLGWQEADGTMRKEGNRIVTKERQLAMMAQVLGFKHGLPLGVRRVRLRATNSTGLKKTYYEIIQPGTDTYVRKFKKGYLIKIHTLKEIKPNGRLRLYDIQVEGDESFCVSVASLHNCQIHWKRAKAGEGDHFVRSFTRNLKDSSAMFPELQNIGEQIKADEVILDAEGIGINPETKQMLLFQETITRKRKHGVEEASEQVPIKFYVFDVLYNDGKSLIDKPLRERRRVLESIILPGRVLETDEQIQPTSPDELRDYHAKLLDQGLEGAVIKKIDGAYTPGRLGWNWVKFKEAEDSAAKLSDTIDAVVMGFWRGEGKRAQFGMGKLLLGVRKGGEDNLILTVSRLGTGMSEAQLVELRQKLEKLVVNEQPTNYVIDKSHVPDFWVKPEMVLEVAADEITVSKTHSAGLALRFPRLVRERLDKNMEQVTTVDELREIQA